MFLTPILPEQPRKSQHLCPEDLEGNLAEIADYILNRVGACGLAWGAFSQKVFSIGTGCNILGIPAVLGPHSSKYRRA